MAFLLLGGWWLLSRSAERERNQQAFDLALDQAEAALRKENYLYGEIDAALSQAEKRQEQGVNDASRQRFEQYKKDRRMLAQLDAIDAKRWSVDAKTNRLQRRYGADVYPTLFREYGIDPENDEPARIAAKVRDATIAQALTVAMHRWWGAGGEMRGFLDALDPDPKRIALRALLTTKVNQDELRTFVAGLQGGALPPVLAQFIGENDRVSKTDAMRLLQQAMLAHPSNFGLAATAALREADDQLERTIAYYQIALALRPDMSWCHNNLGTALSDKGDEDAAIAAYREAIRLDPKFSSAHSNLGTALSDKGDKDAAIAAYSEAIRLDPKNALAHNGLGNVLAEKGDLEGALLSFREAIRVDPKNSKPHNGLGNILSDKGDKDGAIAEYREAIRLDPKESNPHNGLGTALSDKGDKDAAIAAYREAIRLDPKFSEAHSNLGTALSDKGDKDAAIAAYREAIRLDPKNALAHNGLGNVLSDQGDNNGAIAAFREAIRLDPKEPHSHSNLGKVLLLKGDHAGSVAPFRQAVMLRPDWADPLTHLSVALSGSGQPFAGLRTLRDAAKDHPDWWDDLEVGFRYNSACCAVLAGSGQGKDAPPVAQQPGLRKEARDWLAADLAAWRQLVVNKADREKVHEQMTHWLEDEDLNWVRDMNMLKNLPAAERTEWEKLWGDVRQLRDQTAPAKSPPPKSAKKTPPK
jgi:tetratricopeptide (TPR) repeat protein